MKPRLNEISEENETINSPKNISSATSLTKPIKKSLIEKSSSILKTTSIANMNLLSLEYKYNVELNVDDIMKKHSDL